MSRRFVTRALAWLRAGSPLLAVPLAAALLLPAPALAQVLTLREAVERATRTHPSVVAAQLGVEQAVEAQREARKGMSPGLSLSGGINRSDTAGLIRPSTPAMGPYGFQMQLSAVQPIYDAQRTASAVRLADLAERLAEVERIGTRRRLAYETALAYFSVLQAESMRDAARINVEQAKEQLSIAELRSQGQVGTRLEVLQAEASVAIAQEGYVQELNQLFVSRRNLESLLGESLADVRLDVLTQLKELDYDPGQIARALEARPEVAQAILSRESQAETVRLRARATWPTLNALGDVAALPGGGTQQTVAASLAWNFFDSGRADAQVAQARLGVERAEAVLAATRRTAALEVQTTAQGLQAAQERVAIAKQGLQAAIEGLKLAKVRFNAGVGTGLEVTSALSYLSQAQSAYIQGIYSVTTFQLRLAQALGLDLEELLP
ncbi:outer membrane channel protein [compost metagenome]